MGHFKAETVGEFVALGLVHPNQHSLFGLVCNRLLGTNGGPVENIKIV